MTNKSHLWGFGALSTVLMGLSCWTLITVVSLRDHAQVAATKIDEIRRDVEMVRDDMRQMTPLTLHRAETAELHRRIHAAEDKIDSRGDRITRLESEASHLSEKAEDLQEKIEVIEIQIGLKKGNE